MTKLTLISVSIFTGLDTLLGIVFTGISNPDNVAGVIIVALVLKVLWSSGLIALSFMLWRTSQTVYVTLLAFHDFLIDYRQTPRSKMLKRHMPKMEAVVEEASMYEQSAMGGSVLSPNSSSINTVPGSIVL